MLISHGECLIVCSEYLNDNTAIILKKSQINQLPQLLRWIKKILDEVHKEYLGIYAIVCAVEPI